MLGMCPFTAHHHRPGWGAMRMGCPAPLDGTGGPRAPLDSGLWRCWERCWGVGEGSPSDPGGRRCPGLPWSPEARGARLSVFWRPRLSLRAFQVRSSVSFRNHVGAALLGRKPGPTHGQSLALCLWSRLRSSAPEHCLLWEIAGFWPRGSSQALSTSVHRTPLLVRCWRWPPANLGVLFSRSLNENVECNGTRLFSKRNWNWSRVFVKCVGSPQMSGAISVVGVPRVVVVLWRAGKLLPREWCHLELCT